MKLYQILCALVAGLAIGVLLADTGSDWSHNSLMASLQSDCRDWFGPKAALIYNDGRFLCLPERR